jgi:hypothetical protein
MVLAEKVSKQVVTMAALEMIVETHKQILTMTASEMIAEAREQVVTMTAPALGGLSEICHSRGL